MRCYETFESPLGPLLAVGDGEALHGLYMQAGRKPGAVEPGCENRPEAFAALRLQLDEYFAGRRQVFDLPLRLTGTPFRQRVWEALREVGYGETLSYGELAARIGRPGAARAVGAANGANPIAVIVPCHRLLGGDGALVDYAGGLESKRRLLDLERERVAGASP